ncbi:hypothetical protein LY78DRAFT_333591 [Colletotrichum sublineola]|nr:hypothetical protein LY78DRAFT_333591 [Colletotrichum sublineola]
MAIYWAEEHASIFPFSLFFLLLSVPRPACSRLYSPEISISGCTVLGLPLWRPRNAAKAVRCLSPITFSDMTFQAYPAMDGRASRTTWMHFGQNLCAQPRP